MRSRLYINKPGNAVKLGFRGVNAIALVNVFLLTALYKMKYLDYSRCKGLLENRFMNPPPLPKQLQQILGKSLEDAIKIAEVIGYRVEVLIPEKIINVWGEEEETGWVIIPSEYASDKINITIDSDGKITSFDY
jgi:hypothetical protein